MKKFMPEFKDDNDRTIMVFMILATIFLTFISPLVVTMAMKEHISESSYNISKAFLNFELLLLIVSVIFIIVCLIPGIGWVIGFLLGSIIWTGIWVFNVVIAIMALFAISQDKEVSVPVWFEFV